MNIQSNLNIKYNIHVHCTDSMHLISIKKKMADKKFQKKGNNPQNVSIVTWPSPKMCIFLFLVQGLLQRYIWLRGTIQFWKSDRIPTYGSGELTKNNIFDHFANISSLKQLFGYRFLEFNNVSKFRGLSWSYGSFYNYLWNQCLSPLKLCIQISFMARCIQYNSMW